jgi:hypothetical protein
MENKRFKFQPMKWKCDNCKSPVDIYHDQTSWVCVHIYNCYNCNINASLHGGLGTCTITPRLNEDLNHQIKIQLSINK